MKQRLESWGLLVLAMLPIWVAGPFPTYDGPQHLLAGYLLNHLDDPGAVYARYLERQPAFSALIAPLTTALFERVVSIEMAGRLMLSVVVLLQASGFLALLRGVDPRPSPFRWMAPLYPYGFLFYMGFLNFSAGAGLGLWALAHVVRIARGRDEGSGEPPPEAREAPSSPRRQWLWVALLLLATALSHAVAALLTGLLMGLVVLVSARPRLPALGRLLAASLPALTIIGMVGYLGFTAGDPGHPSSAPALGFDLGALWWLPRDLYETPYVPNWPANVLVGLTALVALVTVWRGPRSGRGLLAGLGILLAVLVCLPVSLETWEQVPIRLSPFIVATAVAAASTALSAARARMVAALVTTAATVAALVFVVSANLQLADLQQEFDAGLGQARDPAPRRLFLRNGSPDPDRPGSYMAANLHVDYMIGENAMFSFVFRNRPEAHLLRQTEAWAELEVPNVPSLADAPPEVAWQVEARMGLYYDEVLLWDPPDGRVAAFQELGFDTVFHQDRVWRMRPALRTLRVSLPDQGPPTVAAVFFSDLLWPYTLCLPVPDGAGRRSCLLERLPARPVRIDLRAVRGDPGVGTNAGLGDLAASETIDMTAGSREWVVP